MGSSNCSYSSAASVGILIEKEIESTASEAWQGKDSGHDSPLYKERRLDTEQIDSTSKCNDYAISNKSNHHKTSIAAAGQEAANPSSLLAVPAKSHRGGEISLSASQQLEFDPNNDLSECNALFWHDVVFKYE